MEFRQSPPELHRDWIPAILRVKDLACEVEFAATLFSWYVSDRRAFFFFVGAPSGNSRAEL